LFFLISSLYPGVKVAIIEFDCQDTEKSEAFTERLSTDLFRIGNYEVVDRNSIKKILAEQAFQLSGITSGDAIELGKILGVKYIITGNITTINGFYSDTYSVTAKILDVETAQVYKVGSADIKGSFNKFLNFGSKSISLQLSEKSSSQVELYPKNWKGSIGVENA